ncbi:MAG: radical SAM protein [Deltaproteobacteria bacterium]
MKPNLLFVSLPAIPYDSIIASFSNNSLSVDTPGLMSMPLGILYLSSYIKKNSEVGKVGILDYVANIDKASTFGNLDNYILEIAKKDIDFIPDIIAFSLLFSISHPLFKLAVKKLKAIWPNAVVIVGGVHATNCTELLLENEDVSYVARGEGEVALAEFIKQFSSLQEINVKGIYSKNKINSAAELELCEFIEDLDLIPFPDWELIDMGKYTTSTGRKRNIGDAKESKIASFITTRGCAYRCTFCASHSAHGRKMRYRSVENVIEEVKILHHKYGVTLFIPEDDLFTVNKKRVLRLLSELKALNIPDFELQFPNALAINTLDEEILDALIDSGTKIVSLAIESGSEYVQRYIIKKNCNLKKAVKLVKYLKDKGIMVRCYFILGFPKETKAQMQETIEYSKRLGADWCLFNIASPLKGSEMHKEFVDLGYIVDDEELWSKSFFQERAFDTDEISAEEIKNLNYRANLECNFINNPNKVNGKYEKAIDIYQDIVKAYPFHIVGWYCIMECYEGMGDIEKAESVKNKIIEKIKNDERSAKMLAQHHDLMPKMNQYLELVTKYANQRVGWW